MAITSYDEETLWDLVWLLFGGSAMIAGFITGARHDDLTMMIGTTLIFALVIPYVTRNTLATAYERIHMGRLKKERPVLVLTVADCNDSDRVGVVEALSNHQHIQIGTRLQVLKPSRPRSTTEPVRAGVFIGRTAASTLRTQDADLLYKGQVLVVREIRRPS